MKPEAESISDMLTHMNIMEIVESFDVQIPEEVKYCPYNGSYEQMIHKAMNEREKKIKEFQMLLQN